MGIYCNFTFDNVRIPKDRYELVKQAALKRDKELRRNNKMNDKRLKDIPSIFQEFGYTVTDQGLYYDVGDYDGDKLGYNEEFWRAMAPAVESGFIGLTVEDDSNEHYKWRFVGGKMVEFIGRVVFEDEGEFYLKRIRAR